MSVVIHGMPASVCTRRVMAVLEELEVPYNIKVVDVLSGMNNVSQPIQLHRSSMETLIDISTDSGALSETALWQDSNYRHIR